MRRVAVRRRLATFHRQALPSWSPVARSLPSGLNATAYTAELLGSVRVAIRLWVATSHRYVLPSTSAVARVWPSGLNATPYTELLLPGATRAAVRLPAGPHR